MMINNPNNQYPISSPTVIYMPPMGDRKVSRSVSVVAIVLLVALLFVGMGMVSEKGFYKKEKVTWNRGYIDENGQGVYTGMKGKNQLDGPVGMYTKNAIPIKYGVKIELDFDSVLTYKVLVYNEHDGYLGTLGNPYMTSVTLESDDFTGEFAQANYIRIFAYPRDTGSNASNFISNKNGGVTFWTWLTRKGDFNIYVNQTGFKNTFEEWFG